ncbi:MAG: hypothetical protein M1833_002619 [Piccolia ochrophora]|nr:MAG: hypothetical protein M1833_002619 [Piccolia ochrophora]
MATNVPAKLKAADMSRFALRATQLAKFKPVVAYWCNYWMANQIISKGLHQADAECQDFTTQLMDRLEQTKVENPDNDAITDNVAGQAYVEQFGLETFQRADKAIQANKVSSQTADTFRAAATFLDLLQIWATPDQELASKIKYAKFHALRITKAINAGEDPNLTNPKPESLPDEQATFDATSIDAQGNDAPPEHANSAKSRQPSVQDVPDEHDAMQKRLAARSSLDQSLHPSRASSVPRPADPPSPPLVPTPPNEPVDVRKYYSSGPGDDNVSPIEPAADEGGYFPEVPTFTGEQSGPSLPTAPPQDTFGSHPQPDLPNTPDFPPHTPPSSLPPTAPDFDPHPPPPPPSTQRQQPPASYSQAPSRPQSSYAPPQQPTVPSHSIYRHPPPIQQPSTQSPATQHPPTEEAYSVDEEAIMRAQKHARWAISALNFEDVNTAVRELRGALEILGAK